MMLNVSSRSFKKLLNKNIFNVTCIHCKYSSVKTSEEIRNGFLDFFINENAHKFIRSSPVVPFCDPTVPFVNAGMNQFKGIFLGQFSPPFPCVVNSQKCVRVGGKHNDLEIVGSDGYHHTFFEMLGNWSFGNYYKLEACQMAWKLLTERFNIDPNKLTVTYFGGDKNIRLDADLECKDIWRSIGVLEKHIMPGDIIDNFWEMGTVGPCGPCTEIYYRTDDGSLMEIWNIVFIQFNRQSDGSITPLPKCHVDTGMGLERMATLLQNKSSNYDTDLFTPLLQTIHKKSVDSPPYMGQFGRQALIDTAYRTLADHSRMISVSLADGVFPCRNLRLRNVIRKAISISNNTFKCPTGMLSALYDQVAESLGSAYPELNSKGKEVKQVIQHEEQALATLEKSVNKQRQELLEKYPETIHLSKDLTPGLAEGYKQFKQAMKSVNNHVIPGSLAFKMYDTFGLDESMISKIAFINNLTVDMDSFKEFLVDHKTKHRAVFTESSNQAINVTFNSKVDHLLENNIPVTNDEYKYQYSVKDGGYNFPSLKSKLVGILTDEGDSCDSLVVNGENIYHLIFDKTNFYCEEGGQLYDIGKININGMNFNVHNVLKLRGLVLHSVKFSDSENNDSNLSLSVGASASLIIDGKNRTSSMQHHTAIHLLNAAVKKVLPKSVTCQLSSKVTSSGLTLDLAVYGDKLSSKSIRDAQELVRMACSKSVPVKTTFIDSQELLSAGEITTVPGEIYPESGLRLVEIDLLGTDKVFSRELCCGTHVTSTDMIAEFCITSVRGAGSHSPTIKAVAGDIAAQIYKLASEAKSLHKELEYNDIPDKIELQERINGIRNELNELCGGEGAAYGVRADCLEILTSVEKKIKDKDTKTLKDLVKSEMGTIMAANDKRPYIVHFLICSYLLEPSNLSLTAATECVNDKPILVLGCACGIIKATCCVPQNCVTKNFNAEKWLESIIPVFETHVIPPTKNQDPNIVAHMKGKKVSLINCESLVAEAIKKASSYADRYVEIKMNNKSEQWSQEVKKIDQNN